jgi:hypothetical protein
MNKINLKLENCYGIGSLSETFDFHDGSVFSIYAPNGFMKTSLSKTFFDLSQNKPSSDLIHPDRNTTREITDEAGLDIKAEHVFVIEPYNETFNSEKSSLLLVNQAIKKQYDDALKKIELKKDELIKKLKQMSGLTGRTITPETELLKSFAHSSIYELLESLENDVNESDKEIAHIVYERLFNEKTLPFLESGQISTQLSEYIDKYNELIDASPILSKGFNHYHAKTINKNLSDNGFFDAQHSVNLFNGADKEEMTSYKDLDDKIEGEKKRILDDAALNKKFEEIDKKLTTKELREFRDYLLDNREVVAKLDDIKKLQKNLWLSYLYASDPTYIEFIKEYKTSKEIINSAIEAAKQEKTQWEEVVKIFNRRFTVPFELVVSNQEDVILKGSAPSIDFAFKDDASPKKVDKKLLLQVLSQGEKRALYILNILFEINARKKQGQETLVVADDIADSFDYRNKYAIVEFLKEVSKLDKFNCIFLTHNFDFHRTISSRLSLDRPKRIFVMKSGRNVSFKTEEYQNNPFEHWFRHFQNPKFVISAIPFVRNLAQYCFKTAEFDQLTSLLHIKTNTNQITLLDLEVTYRSVINKPNLTIPNPNKIAILQIYELADSIEQEANQQAELESKIILSISIRLKAEEYMIGKINDKAFLNGISSNQTAELLARFKSDFPNEANKIELLEQVSLMTPENIHLNSFMYEPILDMSPERLKSLYADIKTIGNS